MAVFPDALPPAAFSNFRTFCKQCHAVLKTPEIKSLQDSKLRNYTENVATVTLTDPQIDLINTRRRAKPDGRYAKSKGQAR
jgi:hypothetical protein